MTTNPSPGSSPDLATPRAERPPETMPDGTTVRPWGWFSDGPGSPYLATQHHGRLYVMGFARKGMRDAQPIFQVRENGRYGVMRTATEIGPDWPRHPDAALIVAAVNDYDRLRAIEAAAREAIEALGFWDSDGRQRVSFPVDRDGESTPESDAPFIALRAALQGDKP